MATPVPSKAPPAPPPKAGPPSPTKPAAPAQSTKASKLGLVKKGKLGLPPRVLIYGPEGVGKTSLAADAGALFLDVEGGSGQLDVARYPFNPGEHDEYKPRDYDQIVAAVDDLIANPGHGHPAIAIDTGDALEALIHAHLCKKNSVSSIEKVGGGFNKGYRAAVEELRKFQHRLDQLRAQGVMVIVLCHSQTVTFHNPEGDDYDRYTLKVHASDKVSFAGQLKEWPEIVGFLHFEGGAKKGEEDDRARGWTTNARLLELSREAAWDAKWRLLTPIAKTIEIAAERPWALIADAIIRERNQTPIADQIKAELDRIVPDGSDREFTTSAGKQATRSAIAAFVATADSQILHRVLANLAATPAIQEP